MNRGVYAADLELRIFSEKYNVNAWELKKNWCISISGERERFCTRIELRFGAVQLGTCT